MKCPLFRCALLASVLIGTASCSSADGSQRASSPVATVPPPDYAAEPGRPRTITLSSPESTAPAEPAQPPRPAWEPGQVVRVLGTISNTPWQHLVAHIPGKLVEYLDLEDGGQTVIYIDKSPHCPGMVEVEGVVMEVQGSTKRPGGPRNAQEESFSELHINVSRMRCL